jgi:general secretion pathway protein K
MSRIWMKPSARPAHQAQRGAALLMAMVIVTLVATLAASMVWQQWRAVQVESAERVRSQANWVLAGALDDLGEAWAIPLAEARLSTFLAADSNNNSADTDDAPEAFMSGKVEDAQAKFNVRNLIANDGQIVPEQVKAFKRLLESLSVAPSLADGMAANLSKAALATQGDSAETLTQIGGVAGRAEAALLPQSTDQLLWLGLDAGTLEKLRPFITLLPGETKVNVNTASKEVISAVVDKLDVGSAARLVQARQRKPFKDLAELEGVIGKGFTVDQRLDVKSEYFEVSGRLRYEDNIIEQRHLVHRDGQAVVVLQQSRISGLETPAQEASPP